MDKKYKKFYMMFDKRFKNLILCSNLNCDGGIDLVVTVSEKLGRTIGKVFRKT